VAWRECRLDRKTRGRRGSSHHQWFVVIGVWTNSRPPLYLHSLSLLPFQCLMFILLSSYAYMQCASILFTPQYPAFPLPVPLTLRQSYIHSCPLPSSSV
jgi:hypothetical protein